MYFDTSRVLTAYEERDEKPGTDAEKKQYNQFIALHPSIPDFIKFIVADEDLIDDLGKVIDHHISEAKNSDTNTLRHLITKILPENPNRDVIDPPLTGKSKSERGFNHKMTGALLCPLSLRAEYDRDPGDFNDKVNAGEITIKLDDYPSGFYPPKTQYDHDFIEEKLFQGYPFIRALRAIFSGEESALDGKRSAAKASQAEMHGLARVTPEAVAYTGVHLVFALTDIENWAVAHHSSLNFAKFHADMVRIFADPEDEWGTETLDYLTSKLPKLRKKQAKRKRPVDDEDSDGEKESATTRSLKNRQARRAQRAAAERQDHPERVAEPHPPAAPVAPAPAAPLPAPPRTPCPNNNEDNDETPPHHHQTQRHVVRSPSRSPTPEFDQPDQPPPSSSPGPQSSPPRPPPGLMGPPPLPRYPHTLRELTNELRNSRPSFMNRNRSPTQADSSHIPLPNPSSRRSTLRDRTGTKATASSTRTTAGKSSKPRRK
ncbi:hypothetical protein BJ165DRAFT_1514308 [Panaeolus papilionaceus]|nr:hypothetical protein BJ165DRAFT_1514308 [Panaeolus papilionaceus]